MTARRKTNKKKQKHPLQTIAILLLISGIGYIMNLHGCNNLTRRESSSPQYNGTLVATHIEDLDMARTPKGCPSQIIRHTGHTLSYNKDWRLANWVGYELTAQETDGEVERTDWFAPDPDVKGIKVQHADYTHSGFDRGHLAPAADMKWDKQAMTESFYMTNICPQVHALNAGVWNTLESRIRNWARRDSAVIVVCGPIVDENHSTIGKNRIAIPGKFYKVVAAPYLNSPRGIAFIIPNEDTDAPLYTYAVSIDSVENLTGIDFLYNLPDTLENFIESNTDLQSWQL